MAKKEKVKKEVGKKIEEMSSDEILDLVSDDDRHDITIFTNEPTILNTSLGDVSITPWSLGEYAQVGGVIEAMLKDLEDAGINSTLLFMRPATMVYYEQVMQPMAEGKKIDPDIEEIYAAEVHREQAAITRLFARAALPALAIIKHSCGFSEEEVAALDADEGLGIFSAIIIKNMSVLGKAFELFGKQLS
jgi:hypothetical protein